MNLRLIRDHKNKKYGNKATQLQIYTSGHFKFLIQSIYVIRFYKTDPNRTSGKIKLTPPVDSYTIVL